MDTRMGATNVRRPVDVATELAVEFKKTAKDRDSGFQFPMAEMCRLKESGLVRAVIPKEFGGWGLNYVDMVEIVRILAMGNMSVAQMFATSHSICVQHLDDALPSEMRRKILSRIAHEDLLVANASSERKSKDVAAYTTVFMPTADGAGVSISGEKFFCTGSPSADIIYVVGMLDGAYALGLVDPKTPGVDIRDDWRAMGQRGTGSGTIKFEKAFMPNEYVVKDILRFDAPNFENFFGPIVQGYFSAIFVGAARAALEDAIDYINKHTRPWPGSGVERGAEDPYVLAKAGELGAMVSAAEALIRDMARKVDAALIARKMRDPALAEIRSEAMVRVAEAKVFSTEVGLRVASEIFQMCGTRSSLAEYDFDRYWRDIRTLSLHDPVTYKMRLIGEYIVLGRQPVPTFFS